MWNKKKFLDILVMSLLLSIALGVSIINFFSGIAFTSKEALSCTFLFLVLWICGLSVAYILKNRVITFFIFGYFSLVSLCLLSIIVSGIFSDSWNAFLAAATFISSSFFGIFSLFGEGGLVAALLIAIICAGVSLALSILLTKDKEK